MAKIMQFRYYQDKDEYNNPATLSGDDLASGNLFRNYGLVSSLGIQGPPGLKFYLNDGEYPIVIGNTGIYQLDLSGSSRIVSIKFPGLGKMGDQAQKDLLSNERKLIIDIVYGGGI
jgi:hypothetical protein